MIRRGNEETAPHPDDPVIEEEVVGEQQQQPHTCQVRPSSPPTQQQQQQQEEPPPESTKTQPQSSSSSQPMFECNICFDQAAEPVITVCGHLFCWACLYKWLESQQVASQTCPVCKAGIERDKIIPIYGRGKSTPSANVNQAPSGTAIPSRPMGQRPAAPPNPNFHPPHANHPFEAFNFFPSLGTGGFSWSFTWPPAAPQNNQQARNVPQDVSEQKLLLARFMVLLGIIVLLYFILQ